MGYNILYILNHKTLSPFELPILKSKNIGFYIPKVYDSINTVYRSCKTISCSDDNLIYNNISEEDYKYLNTIDFLNKAHIIGNSKLMEIINKSFHHIIITLLSYEYLLYLSLNYKGIIYLRLFGDTIDGFVKSYYERITYFIQTSIENLKNVRYIFAFQEIIDYEKTKSNYFNDSNTMFLPIGLPNDFWDKYENTYNPNSSDSFVFVNSRMDIIKNEYHNFNNLFLNSNLKFKILGHTNDYISKHDERVMNNLTDDEYFKQMTNSIAMYYHSKETQHLCYHPLEAVIVGLPVIFHSESLLSTYLKNSPGRCFTDNEVIEKLQRLKDGDTEFRNSIINYQNLQKFKLKTEYFEPFYNNLIDSFQY